MSESVTINLIVTSCLVPVVVMFIWLIKTTVNYFFKDGGFLDDMRGSTKDWFTAQKEYMEASKTIQATTANRLDKHDATVMNQTSRACDALESIVARQLEHGEHLETLVIAGTRACEVASLVCAKLELGNENAEAIKKIRKTLEAKAKDNGGN